MCIRDSIIAVPTPNLDDEFLSCDLTYVLEAAKEIIPYVEKGKTVIVESTIAPRSTDDYVKPIDVYKRQGKYRF